MDFVFLSPLLLYVGDLGKGSLYIWHILKQVLEIVKL